MNNLITIQDLFIVPFLLLVAYFVGTRIKNKHIKEKPYYKYFVWGLWVKIFAGLAFAGIYLFYYGGGDTVYYFHGTQCTVNMLAKDIPTFFKIIFGNHSPEVGSMFDRYTGYPYYFRDPNSFSVCRFNVPFYLLGLGSYMGNTIVMNLFLFLAVWKFYEMIIEYYPSRKKEFAIAIFFVPSVVFWSSGILKDGWTLTAIFASFVHLNNIFIQKKKIYKNILGFLIWSYIAFAIRPYIFYVTMGSGLIWLGLHWIKSIKSNFMRTLAMPLIVFIIWLFGIAILAQTSSVANKRYSSIENILETAQVIQDDLTRDAYGSNSFDIGYFEPTLPGVLAKFPKALTAGLFRPFIWEANNVLMLVSGVEGIIILIIFGFVLKITRISSFFRNTFKQPILMGLLVFTITFAFFVGLTTANFGAMVRYRIPVLPFFLIILFANFKDTTQENKSLE